MSQPAAAAASKPVALALRPSSDGHATSPALSGSDQAQSRDLWTKACTLLYQKEKEVIASAARDRVTPASSKTLSPSPLDAIIASVRNKQDLCERKRWKVRVHNQDIILRDYGAKILTWLQKFKEIGDIAVQYDPATAALPWATVRFVLQAAISEHEQMGALLMGVEAVSRVISRCSIYEALYTPESVSRGMLEDLDRALVELYAAALKVLANAHDLFSKNTAKRTIKAILTPGAAADLIGTLREMEGKADAAAATCEKERSVVANREMQQKMEALLELSRSCEAVLVRLDAAQGQVLAGVENILESMAENDRLRVLEWISSVPYNRYHNDVRRSRTMGTGEWLTERHATYRAWQNSSTSVVLWLYGIPGAGKSHLASKVIDDLHSRLTKESQNHEALAYFHCKRDEALRRDPVVVLRSFMRQLATPPKSSATDQIHKALVQLEREHRLQGSDLDLETCKKCLKTLVDSYTKTIFVLDALDECEEESRGELLDVFDELVSTAARPVKIFISSRPDVDIKRHCTQDEDFRSHLEIQATDNQEDIAAFVKEAIAKHKRWTRMPMALQTDVISTILIKSQGMFQWASLQVRQLLECRTAGSIRARLGALPADLKTAYDEIYARILKREDFERKIAQRAFQWVLGAAVPPTTPLLIAAVCQDPETDCIDAISEDIDGELLLELTENLLVLDSAASVWRVAHLSVAEYLERHHWSTARSNAHVATICTLSVAFHGPNAPGWEPRYCNPEGPASALALQFYADHMWIFHLQRAELHVEAEQDVGERLLAVLADFLAASSESCQRSYDSWVSRKVIISHGDKRRIRFRDRDTAVLRKAIAGAPKAVSYPPSTLRPRPGPDGELSMASYIYILACGHGLFRVLAEWWSVPRAEMNATVTDEGVSILALAFVSGQAAIIERLLHFGADVNMQLDYQGIRSYRCTALGFAAYEQQPAAVKLLLEAGANPNASPPDEEPPLHMAMKPIPRFPRDSVGPLAIYRLLIDAGADVHALSLETGSYFQSSVLAAILIQNNTWDMEPVMSLLLDQGVDVNTPIHLHTRETPCYITPLVQAIHNHQWSAARVMIARGAKLHVDLPSPHLDHQGISLGNALAAAVSIHDAVANQRPGMIQAVLDAGADVNTPLDGRFESALAVAAWHSNVLAVDQLLAAGAHVDLSVAGGRSTNLSPLATSIIAVREQRGFDESMFADESLFPYEWKEEWWDAGLERAPRQAEWRVETRVRQAMVQLKLLDRGADLTRIAHISPVRGQVGMLEVAVLNKCAPRVIRRMMAAGPGTQEVVCRWPERLKKLGIEVNVNEE